ncbi:MAG: DUF1214 domain-containing protein [Candidatus Hydrogenedentota bacterium]|nr:MAG: DUF1214 domain-containing protein [Candidatus Hydrogenedentota bacterium]
MYNVNNKFAMDPGNPTNTGGWNRIKANTTLLDHTMKAIARPNNDTLYIGAMLDLTNEPVILEAPAFDSKYVSLMATGYDHYVNIPMSTTQGDFSRPSRILFYTERTKGYQGEPVEGVDRIAEMTGDFVSAVYRVMPHTAEPERLQRNLDAMRKVKVLTLSEYRSGVQEKTPFRPWPSPSGKSADLEAREDALEFPAYGKTDFDIFEHNLLEVMQFVFNHTTFDPDNELDRRLLAAYKPLGVVPGRAFDPGKIAQIDGARFRDMSERIASRELSKANDPEFLKENLYYLFLPKGQMTLERLLFQSILGPIGQPASEAVYPSITTSNGTPMNAMNDYVIRMKKDDLPPATAFWSITLYDTENGFFLPNERKKYSVGENAGMKLDADDGITIYIAADCPQGVPEENCLPLNRGDYGVDLIMRVYAPDLEKLKTWKTPQAEKVK